MKLIKLTALLLIIALIGKGENTEKKNQFLEIPNKTSDNASKANQSGINLKFVGNLYIAPENWPKVGDGTDPKFGLGLGGMLGLGLRVDDMVFAVGPHIGINRWQADYSKKAQSATSSVYVELYDIGIEGVFYMMFDKTKMSIILGKGNTEISSGYVVDGETIMYPNLDKAKETYTSVGIGFNMGKLQIAPVYVRYSGVAKAAERLEIRLGLAF